MLCSKEDKRPGDYGNKDSNFKHETGGGGKKIGKAAIIIAMCAVTLTAVLAFAAGLEPAKARINLNEYLKIKYEGFDTMGYARAEFDLQKLYDDYKEDLKFGKVVEGGVLRSVTGRTYDEKAYLEFLFANPGRFSRKDRLSNGDEVVYAWNVDSEGFGQVFGCTLTWEDVNGTVEGLQECFRQSKQIGEDDMKYLIEDGAGFVKKKMRIRDGRVEKVDSVDYRGNVFMYTKGESGLIFEINVLLMIYNVELRLEDPATGESTPYSYYVAVKYHNLLSKDGKLDRSDLRRDIPLNNVFMKANIGGEEKTYVHDGYETVEELQVNLVDWRSAEYTVEKNI